MRRMPEERENELVLMAQKGSTKAFGELEKQYHWLVFKVANDILHDYVLDASIQEAEDVTQEVFEYAFVHIKDYRMPSRFYRWLWGLAKNRAMRLRRKLYRQHHREFEYEDERRCWRDAEGFDWTPADPNEAAHYLNPARWDGDQDYNDDDSWFVQWKRKDFDALRKGLAELPKRQREDLEAYADGEKPRQIAKRTGRNVRAVYTSLNAAKVNVRKTINSDP